MCCRFTFFSCFCFLLSVQTEDINPQERYDKLNDTLKQIRKEIDSLGVNVDGDFTEHKNKLEVSLLYGLV